MLPTNAVFKSERYESAERIGRMGEAAERIWSFGSPGIDSILTEPT